MTRQEAQERNLSIMQFKGMYNRINKLIPDDIRNELTSYQMEILEKAAIPKKKGPANSLRRYLSRIRNFISKNSPLNNIYEQFGYLQPNHCLRRLKSDLHSKYKPGLQTPKFLLHCGP